MLRLKDSIEDQRLLGALLALYILTLTALLLTAPRADTGSQNLEIGNAEWLVVLFTSQSCRLCDEIRPYWNEITLGPDVNAVELSLSDPKAFRIAISYGVARTPTILVLDRELKEVSRLEWDVLQNVKSSAELADIIKKHLRPRGEERPPIPSAFSLALYPVLGAAIALSPCSAPLIALYASASMASRAGARTALKCALLAGVGLAVICSIAVTSLTMLTGFVEAFLKALGFLLIALGFVAIASRDAATFSIKVQARSLEAACLSFGVMASHCSLPLLVGSLLSPAALGLPALGLIAFLLLVAGLAITLAVVVYTSGSAASVVYKLIGAENLVRLGGAVVIALGVYASLLR